MARKQNRIDLKRHHKDHLAHLLTKAPFILRITEWRDYPVPVLVIKERQQGANGKSSAGGSSPENGKNQGSRHRFVERGHLCGERLRICIPILRSILVSVCDSKGIPLELEHYLTREGLRHRLNLPLNEEAGAKLCLIFRLQERIIEPERVELLARRIERFTREEAAYWLSRTTRFTPDANRWAVAGLRTMLGGQPKDPGVERMLSQLRNGV